MKFYGTVKQGDIKINSGFKEYLSKLEGDFEIKVTLTKDIRNLKMNNLYWWWLTILSNDSGYTKRELHSYFKNKLLCYEDTVNGERVLNCESTSDLTLKEFSNYLIEVGRLANENFNCYLPDQDHARLNDP